MELTSERRIAAPPDRVWQALTDPEVIHRLLPGCTRVDRVSGEEYALELAPPAVAAGHVYAARAHVLQADAPRTLRIAFEGESREGSTNPGGFARGEATATLMPLEGSTLLRASIDAHAGGAMAGSWSGAEQAKRSFDGFLDALVSEIGVVPGRELGAEGAAGLIAAATEPAPPAGPQGARPAQAQAPAPGLQGGLQGGMLGGMLAAIPAEPFGFPRVAWIGCVLFLCIFLLIFSAYV